MRYTSLASTAISLVALATPGEAFWRMSCPGRVITARMDPIVNPGGVAGHVHTVSGGSAFNYTMDYNSTQNSACSSCPIKQDLSNYWTPNLWYRTKDGKFQDVPQSGDGIGSFGGLVVYYLQRGGPNKDPLKAYPKDFRMLAGDPFRRNYTDDFAGQAVSFVCLDFKNGSGYYNKLPDRPCPDGLRAQIFFPSCWDGVNLDSPDHKSHMAYPTKYSYDNGPCPATHPVHMISIFYEVLFSTSGFDWWTPDGNWQPFTFSMGDPTGFGFHGDFLNGWDVPTLQNATDTCTANSGRIEDCPVFQFFDDSTTKGCLIAPTISQPVTGMLDALPGCNPIQDVNATSQSRCNDTAEIGDAAVYYSNFTGWDYLGCAVDKPNNRTFSDASWWDSTVTIQGCMNYCGGNGYQYAGLEYANQCFCSNTLADDRVPVPGVLGNCFTPCAGNATQVCGGASRLSVYKRNTNTTFVPTSMGQPKLITCPGSNGTTYPSSNGTFTVECGFDRGGGDIGMKSAQNITNCFDICASTTGCTFVSLSGTACYMKGGALRPGKANSGVNGGYISTPSNNTASLAASNSTASIVSSATGTVSSLTTSAASSSVATSTSTTTSSSARLSTTSTTTSALAPGATSTLAPTCPTSNGTYYQASTGAMYLIECGIDHQAGDMGMVGVKDLQGCLEACANTTGCVDVSLSGTACYMKKTVGAAKANGGVKGGLFVGFANVSSTSTNASTSSTTSLVSSSSVTTTASTSVVSTTTAAAPTTSSAARVVNAAAGSSSSSSVNPTPASQTTASPTTAASSSASPTTAAASSSASPTTAAASSSASPTTAAASSSASPTTAAASSSASPTTAASSSVSSSSSTIVSSTAVPTTSSPTLATSTLATTTVASTTDTSSSSARPTVTSASCPQNNGTIFVDSSSGFQFQLECGIDHAGGDMSMFWVKDLTSCIAICAKQKGCVDVSLSGAACYLKKSVGTAMARNGINGALLINNGTALTY